MTNSEPPRTRWVNRLGYLFATLLCGGLAAIFLDMLWEVDGCYVTSTEASVTLPLILLAFVAFVSFAVTAVASLWGAVRDDP